jgi:hypothetical protein
MDDLSTEDVTAVGGKTVAAEEARQLRAKR